MTRRAYARLHCSSISASRIFSFAKSLFCGTSRPFFLFTFLFAFFRLFGEMCFAYRSCTRFGRCGTTGRDAFGALTTACADVERGRFPDDALPAAQQLQTRAPQNQPGGGSASRSTRPCVSLSSNQPTTCCTGSFGAFSEIGPNSASRAVSISFLDLPSVRRSRAF